MYEDKSTIGCKGNKKTLKQNVEQKGRKRNTEWINNMNKNLKDIEEVLEVNVLLYRLRQTLNKVSHWKTPRHSAIILPGLTNSRLIHDRLALQRCKCQEAKIPEGESYTHQEGSQKRTLLWQL